MPLQLLSSRCPSSLDECLVRINKGTVISTWATQLANLWRSLKSYSNQRDPNAPVEPIRVHKRTVDLHEKQTYGVRLHVKIQKGQGMVRHHWPVRYWNGTKSGTQLQWQTSSMTTVAQLACVFAVKSFTNTFTLGAVSCTFAGEGYHSCPYMLELLTVCYNFWCSRQPTVAVDSNVWRIQFNAFFPSLVSLHYIIFVFFPVGNKEGFCNNQTKCEAEEEDLLFEKL